MTKSYTGINIQWPISELIISKSKTIETRTYPLPPKYKNLELLLIETPGSHGKFKARARAIIKCVDCFQYKDSKTFYMDYNRHKVNQESLWAWSDKKPKWGWEIEIIEVFDTPILINQPRGIIYTNSIMI